MYHAIAYWNVGESFLLMDVRKQQIDIKFVKQILIV